MENPISFEHIEQYLEGQLSTSDKEAFEKSLASDSELAQRLAKHRQVHTSLKAFARNRIRAEVSDVYKKTKGNTSKTVQFPSWTYAMAAAILVLCMLGVGYIWLKNQHSNPTLFAQHFTPHDLRQTTLGHGEPEDDVFSAFEEAYLSGNYKEAIKAGDYYLTLPDSMRTEKEDEIVRLGLAIAWLKEENPAKAIELLSDIRTKNSQDDVARWYLGLAYLVDNQTDKAKGIFEEIVADPNTNYKRSNAEKILEQMDSFWR